MALALGDTAPGFEAETTGGTISFHDWLGDSWGVLFSHPSDHQTLLSATL
jgi:alkyl hydroperoxide reductase subunit AhpC